MLPTPLGKLAASPQPTATAGRPPPAAGTVFMLGGNTGREVALGRQLRSELGGPPDLRLWLLPWRQPQRTRELVHELARTYGQHPSWRWWTLNRIVIPAGVAEYDDEGAARAIHAWWRDNVRFQPEPGEQVQTPGTTVLFGYGDCEDKAAGIGACLESIGIRWNTELLGNPAFHIWPQALVRGRWAHLEACHRLARFDEHPSEAIRRIGRVGF